MYVFNRVWTSCYRRSNDDCVYEFFTSWNIMDGILIICFYANRMLLFTCRYVNDKSCDIFLSKSFKLGTNNNCYPRYNENTNLLSSGAKMYSCYIYMIYAYLGLKVKQKVIILVTFMNGEQMTKSSLLIGFLYFV